LVLAPAPQRRTDDDADRRRDEEVEPEGCVEDKGGERAQRDEFAVGEVAQARRAEDQAQSKRTESDDEGQDDAVDDELKYSFERDARENPSAVTSAGVTAFAGGDHGEERLLVSLKDIDAALGTTLDLDADRQGCHVDGGGVLAGLGYVDGRQALRVGLSRAGEPLGIRHIDRYARNGRFIGSRNDGGDGGTLRLGGAEPQEAGSDEAHQDQDETGDSPVHSAS
jgi:hypothetical protein